MVQGRAGRGLEPAGRAQQPAKRGEELAQRRIRRPPSSLYMYKRRCQHCCYLVAVVVDVVVIIVVVIEIPVIEFRS